MSDCTFIVTESYQQKNPSLDEEDIGKWAVMVNDQIIGTFDEKEEALMELRAMSDEPTELDFGNMTMGYLQCNDGDDYEDDQGGVWGDFDNTVGEGEWDDEVVTRGW